MASTGIWAIEEFVLPSPLRLAGDWDAETDAVIQGSGNLNDGKVQSNSYMGELRTHQVTNTIGDYSPPSNLPRVPGRLGGSPRREFRCIGS